MKEKICSECRKKCQQHVIERMYIHFLFFFFSGMTLCAEVLRFQRFLLGSCLALVVLSFGSLALADCPEVCTCKWKGGKQTVECINASLSSIPNIEAGTQVLDLGLNYLPTLRTDTFKRNNLTNLQKIYLYQCSLRLLEVHTFR